MFFSKYLFQLILLNKKLFISLYYRFSYYIIIKSLYHFFLYYSIILSIFANSSFFYRTTDIILPNLAQCTFGPTEFNFVRNMDHTLFQKERIRKYWKLMYILTKNYLAISWPLGLGLSYNWKGVKVKNLSSKTSWNFCRNISLLWKF